VIANQSSRQGAAVAPTSELELEDSLSAPSVATTAAMARLSGDLLVLGVGGKLGLSLCRLARRSLDAAGKTTTRVIGVSRFGQPGATRAFEAANIETISADLLADGALEQLPDVPNILYLVGMKFGSSREMPTTWALNTFLPGLVARRFVRSRIVALSTGNVYPLVDVRSGGATESDSPAPVGEYALTCLGRERLFDYYSQTNGTPVAIIRLNYAVDLRYGVLVDIAQRIQRHEAIDLAMGCVNVIWQGDANAVILQALGECASPPLVVNVTGPETLSVRWLAHRFAELLGSEEPVFVGQEGTTALLSNTHRQQQLFGYPRLSTGTLIEWVADWQRRGGRLLDKPTGFQSRDGRF
jgi:nucleoside-diphosphate-sugar epimerase